MFSDCPSAPDVPNANADSVNTEIDTVVTYTCDDGYYFDHSTTTTTEVITCESTGNWTALALASCSGKLTTAFDIGCDVAIQQREIPID